ncbi:transcriptional activator srcap [Fusarium mundagurra]|uniref:Transcriptional activator srcap n=1 Tax=Fusarium mundagurra TaxID=1567541 RepID=A0A8H6D698_9HYPO|nr:transcriptional activator srcap [Fusarium mundagurra]
METTKCGVASYFVNVGQGDGIILLMFSAFTVMGNKKVERAILMDGGPDPSKKFDEDAEGEPHENPPPAAKTPNRNIKRAIADIERDFECQGDPYYPGNRNRLVFDGFVVTHWDKDHARGVMWYLLQDMIMMRERGFKTLSRAHYKDDKPESYFYAPTWKDPTTWDKAYNKNFSTSIVGDGKLGEFDDVMLQIKVEANDLHPMPQTFYRLLKMRVGTQWLIGRNLFAKDDTAVSYSDRDGCESLEKLIETVKPIYKDIDGTGRVPALYCVALNRIVIHSGFQSTITEKNAESICSLVVWSELDNNQKATNVSVSHYLGGDTYSKVELKIYEWMNYLPSNDNSVPVVKLSHHGATSSNPDEMWERLKPIFVVGSSGSGNAHGHPRWEIVTRMYARYMYNTTANRYLALEPFLLTNWPTFLGNIWFDIPEQTRPNIKAFYGRVLMAMHGAWKQATAYRKKEHKKPIPLWDVIQLLADELDGKLPHDYDPTDDQRKVLWAWLRESAVPELSRTDEAYVSWPVIYMFTWMLAAYACENGKRDNRPWNRLTDSAYAQEIPMQSLKEDFRSQESAGRRSHRRYLSQFSTSSWDAISPSSSSDDGSEVGSSDEGGNWKLVPTIVHSPAAPRPSTRIFQDAFPFVDANSFVLVPEGLPKDVAPTPDATIPTDSPLNLFVRNLAGCCLQLSHSPSPPASPSGTVVPVPLAEVDVLRDWLGNIFRIAPQSITVRFKPTAWPLKGSASADMDFSVALDERLSFQADSCTAMDILGLNQANINAMISRSLVFPMGITFNSKKTDTSCKRDSVAIQNAGDDVWTLSDVARLSGVEHPFTKVLGPLPLQPCTKGRNMLWYTANASKTTTLRLEFKLTDGARKTFCCWLDAPQKGLDLTNVLVVLKNTTVCRYTATSDIAIPRGEIIFRLDLKLNSVAFSAIVSFDRDEVTLRLQRDKGMDGSFTLDDAVQWVGKTLGLQGMAECDSLLRQAGEFLKATKPRALEFGFAFGADGGLGGIQRMSATMQVELSAGKPHSDDRIVFFLTFAWTPRGGALFRGNLWSGMPSWEPWREILPDVSGNVLDYVDLKVLCGLQSLPRGLPTQIRIAEISLDKAGMELHGMLVCDDSDDTDPKDVPRVSLGLVDVRTSIQWNQPESLGLASTSFSFSLGVEVLLHAAEPKVTTDSTTPLAPATLIGDISYSDKVWKLRAGVRNLTGAHLAGFFPRGGTRDAAMEMLQHFSMETLDVRYEYDGGSSPPSQEAAAKFFSISGLLNIGQLQLKISFFNKGKGDWEFGAALSPKLGSVGNAPTTIGDLLQGLLGDGNTDPLPFVPGEVKNIPILKPQGDDLLNFTCKMMKLPDQKKAGVKRSRKARRQPTTDSQASAGTHTPEAPNTQLLVLVASVHLSSISLTFIQWRDPAWPSSVPSKRIIKVTVDQIGPFQAPLVGELKSPFDQLVYMWVSDKATEQLAAQSFSKTAVGQLGDSTGQKLEAGVTKREFDALATATVKPTDSLFFKANKEKYADADIVIALGSHFLVVAKNSQGVSTAVLDYVFARPKSPQKSLCGGPSLRNSGSHQAEENPNKDPAKAPYNKALGPLTIENVGLQYEKETNRLGIVLDATFLLGPIGLALLGFSLSCKLQSPSSSLALRHSMESTRLLGDAAAPEETPGDELERQSMPVSDFKVSLAGLIVSFDKDPLTIAGGFMHTTVAGADYYAGGLIFKFKPWMIMAVGVYGRVPRPNNTEALSCGGSGMVCDNSSGDESWDESSIDGSCLIDDRLGVQDNGSFTMLFIIFKLEGPLFSVGFADISGLTGGVGVNSEVRLPTAETVLSFPFVRKDGPDTKAGPIAALTSLLYPDKTQPWFTAREGSFWVAAGCKVTAFTMLDVDAVLVLQLNPDVQIGIYGVATMDVPSLAADIKFAHVELGIACTLDVGAGAFRLDAQLSPRSFVLHESCHLTGGIALYAWFGGTKVAKDDPNRPSNGDFVLTIGGYHQAFVCPPQYPNPPRLGISWALGSALKITGEAYFAVNPRVCMGGGRLHASLSAGPLGAWFDAFIDFLINFRPFHFTAGGGIAVGVRFSLDLWLVTIRISAEISATLSVMGPPMAGTVHVDFWVFGFDINFGDLDAARQQDTLLSVTAFRDLALKSGGGSGKGQGIPLEWVSGKVEEKPETTKPFQFNCDSGLIPNSSVPGTSSVTSFPEVAAWHAPLPKGTWIVRGASFSCTISLGFAATAATVDDQRPTVNEPLKHVEIPEAQQQIFARPMQLREPLRSPVTITITKPETDKPSPQGNERTDKEWGVQPVVKSVPQSIWGQYSPSEDPAVSGNGINTLLDGRKPGSIAAVMGFTITPPLPFKSRDTLPKINMRRDMLQSVNTDGYAFPPDVTKESDAAWDPRPLTEEEKNKATKGKRWDNAVRTWKADGQREDTKKRTSKVRVRSDGRNDPLLSHSEKVVNAWAARLRFAEGALTGRKPVALIARFDDMIPAAPAISVGV